MWPEFDLEGRSSQVLSSKRERDGKGRQGFARPMNTEAGLPRCSRNWEEPWGRESVQAGGFILQSLGDESHQIVIRRMNVQLWDTQSFVCAPNGCTDAEWAILKSGHIIIDGSEGAAFSFSVVWDCQWCEEMLQGLRSPWYWWAHVENGDLPAKGSDCF